MADKCSHLGCKAEETKIYHGTDGSLLYPVTVNLCDAHVEESKADGWELEPIAVQ